MGLITPDIIATAATAIDSLMADQANGGLGKHCTLLLPPVRVRCPNCKFDVPNKRSANRYNGTGPQPFPYGGLCPVCMGKGTIDTPVTHDIVMSVNWNIQTWVAVPGINQSNFNIQDLGGQCQTKGFLTSLPVVLQSRRMILESAIKGIDKYVYVLAGEPIDAGNIIQGRYFYAVWKAAEGQ